MTPREASRTLFALFLLILEMQTAHAWPPTFGGELTFTKPELLRAGGAHTATPENEAARDALAQRVKDHCEGCTVESGVSPSGFKNYKVTYKNGWYFVIAIDPGVVEVQTKPATVAELEQEEARLQRDLFDNAATLGLKPHFQVGAGHIHMGFESAFAEHPGLFRNYFVDLANHPEVSVGSFGIDIPFGPPLALLEDSQRQAFQKILQRYDKGLIADDRAFAKEIQNKVYTEPTYRGPNLPGKKNQAQNLTRIVKEDIPDNERTLENRSLRPQQNAHEFVLQSKLQQARLEYLIDLMKRQPRIAYVDRSLPAYSPGSPAYIAVAQKYVTEAKLNWEEYQILLMDPHKAGAYFGVYKNMFPAHLCSGPLKTLLRIK